MASDKDDADFESRGSDKASPQAIAWALVTRTAPASCPTRDRKSLLDAGFITRFHDDHAYTSDGRRCGLRFPNFSLGLKVAGRVNEERNQCGRGNQFVYQFQTSCGRLDAKAFACAHC
jgi:hypothetical protein